MTNYKELLITYQISKKIEKVTVNVFKGIMKKGFIL
jgi:hypothetical protein